MRSRRIAIWSAVAGVGVAGTLAVTFAPSALASGTPAALIGAGGTASAVSAARSTPPPAPSAPGAVSPRVVSMPTASGANSTSVQQFWTPERMASATPEDATTAGGNAKFSGSTARAPHVATADSSIAGSYYNGRPSIGIIFYAGQDMRTHYCTASVVRSAGKNLIMMAAHCRPSSNMAYVPAYRSGASTQPYGIWRVQKVYVDGHYSNSGSGINYDYAFAKVAKDAKGRQLENVTGGNTLTRTPSYYNWVGVTGYPKVSSAPADKAITCWNHTSKVPGYSQMSFLCYGYYGGTSGSPWLINLDSRTNTGSVIGLIGGLDEGGPNSWTSYSPIFDGKIFFLYNYALSH
ncbi:hypothetical protein ABIA33_004065 [Streptacidiphilus sp. MAP12-16]|uniref:trypsin-like serine peptidase n=1 Tax=Streptacidiphilus sp. MAP12-16 TaxID=3156300 RepID=UPI0035171157